MLMLRMLDTLILLMAWQMLYQLYLTSCCGAQGLIRNLF